MWELVYVTMAWEGGREQVSEDARHEVRATVATGSPGAPGRWRHVSLRHSHAAVAGLSLAALKPDVLELRLDGRVALKVGKVGA